MLSIPDMAILGVLALLIFGEQKLPVIMRQAGRVMRDVQNTSHSFLREMERAAEIDDVPVPPADLQQHTYETPYQGESPEGGPEL